MITRNFKVCLNAGVGSAPYINVNQYDSGETWVFDLFTETGESYTPSSGSIVGIKSDGMVIANAGTVTDGKVVITETQQMTASAGKAIYELQIDSDTHGTANFIVMVEKSPMDGGTLSESDISLYQGLLNITPSNSGTVGQVLTRTADGAEWATGGGGGGAVDSVNGQTGVVVLTASDVGALADSTTIPTKVSQLQNDSGFLTSAVTSFNGNTGAVTYTAPVTSVNGATGAVVIGNATTASAGLMSAQDKTDLGTLMADYSSALTALGVI